MNAPRAAAAAVVGWLLHDVAVYLTSGEPALAIGLVPRSLVLVAVADDTASWASNIATLNSTPAGQAMIRHFNAVVDCTMNLWHSEQIVGGEDG